MIVKMLLSSTAKLEQKKNSVLALLEQNSIIVKSNETAKEIHELKNTISDLQKKKKTRTTRTKGFTFSVNMRRALFFILQMIKDNDGYMQADKDANFGTQDDPISRDEMYAKKMYLCDTKGQDELTQDQLDLMWKLDRPHVEYKSGQIKIVGKMRSLFQDYIVARQSNDSPLYDYSENTRTHKKRISDDDWKETITNSEFVPNQGMALFTSDWNATSTNAIGRGFLAFGIKIQCTQEKRFVELLTKDNPDRKDGKFERSCIKFMELKTADPYEDFAHQNISFNTEFSELLANWLIGDKERTLSMLHDDAVFRAFKNDVIDLGNKLNG
tara:strand:+ start:1 stop:981 length:981 start_codon:yes stop_codon:yes gene_type:complete